MLAEYFSYAFNLNAYKQSQLTKFKSGGKYDDRLVEPQPIRYSHEGRLNLNKLSELPYHMILSSAPSSPSIKVLNTTLYNFEFLEAKAEAGMWEQLSEDVLLAASRLGDSHSVEFKQWFDQNKGHLRLFTNQALQSALHFPDSSFVYHLAQQQLKGSSFHSYKVHE